MRSQVRTFIHYAVYMMLCFCPAASSPPFFIGCFYLQLFSFFPGTPHHVGSVAKTGFLAEQNRKINRTRWFGWFHAGFFFGPSILVSVSWLDSLPLLVCLSVTLPSFVFLSEHSFLNGGVVFCWEGLVQWFLDIY